MNIILVDRALRFVDDILDNPKTNIVVLVIDNRGQDVQKHKSNPRVNNIYTVAELDSMDSIKGLTYSFVRASKDVQLLAENAMERFDTDYNDKKYRYYMGLAFWHRIFEENKIDVVLLTGMSHGFIYDGVLIGVAKQYCDVKIYSLNAIGINRWNSFVFDHRKDQIVSIHNTLQTDDIQFYLRNGSYDVINLDFDCNEQIPDKSGGGLKNYILRKTYQWFGYYGRALLIALRTNSIFKEEQLCSSGFKASLFYTFKCFYQMRRNHHFLANHEKETDFSAPYIYYPLHLEPEATTQTRMVLESQLAVIKMIAECLPEGWRLLVKEHPHQYKLNNDLMYYLVTNGNLFKTKKFYQRIIAMPQVELISSKYNGVEVTKGAKAIASLGGSALLEAVQLEKPILLFSEFHPFVHADSVFNCFSYKECEQSIKKIYDGYEPDYHDILSVMNKYVCSSEEDLTHSVLELIN